MFDFNTMSFIRVLAISVVVSFSISSANSESAEKFLTTVSKKNAEMELEDTSTVIPQLDCDCGVHGNCSYYYDFKVCKCQDGYGNKNGTCTECLCGNNTGCAFGNDIESNLVKICYCRDGYQLKEGLCTECDCGNGLCSFDEWGAKKCECNFRSAVFNGTCQKCECEDDNEKCSFDSHSGRKNCYCLDGFQRKEGTCTECNCGSNANCLFSLQEKHCYCELYSVLVDGICKECECGGASYGCTIVNGEKVCICPMGYKDKSGTCTRCDCGLHAKNCVFKKKYEFEEEPEQVCTCMDGYVDFKGYCIECNCGSNGTCSLSGTKNFIIDYGTKTCYCDQGYVEHEGRCKDICDEGKCNDGVCVVTGFNFTCICNQGFTGLLCDERLMQNISDVSIAIIVFIVLCIAIVGFFIGTLCLVRRNRKLKKQQTKDNCQH